MVEHLSHHPKVKGSSLATVDGTSTERERERERESSKKFEEVYKLLSSKYKTQWSQ